MTNSCAPLTLTSRGWTGDVESGGPVVALLLRSARIVDATGTRSCEDLNVDHARTSQAKEGTTEQRAKQRCVSL